MNTPDQTYKKLSDAVQAMHFGREVSKQPADASENLHLLACASGRREYIRVLQGSPTDAYGTLAGTSENEQKELFTTRFGARKLRNGI